MIETLTSEIDKLRDLLLNNYDNSIFISSGYNDNRSCFGVFEASESSYLANPILLNGEENFYLITETPHEQRGDVFKKLQPTIINCSLTKFLDKYPMFESTKFKNPEFFSAWIGNLYKRDRNNQPNQYGYQLGYQLTPNLYVGESLDFKRYNESEMVEKLQKLKNQGITHIINVSDRNIKDYEILEVQEFFEENKIEVSNIPIQEYEYPGKNQAVHQVADLINEKINDPKNKVYLHCYMGQNRSITCAIMYMMKYQKRTLKEAFLQCSLMKRVFIQNEFVQILHAEASKREQKPISMFKLQHLIYHGGLGRGDFDKFSLGGYHIHALNLIAKGERTYDKSLDLISQKDSYYY